MAKLTCLRIRSRRTNCDTLPQHDTPRRDMDKRADVAMKFRSICVAASLQQRQYDCTVPALPGASSACIGLPSLAKNGLSRALHLSIASHGLKDGKALAATYLCVQAIRCVIVRALARHIRRQRCATHGLLAALAKPNP